MKFHKFKIGEICTIVRGTYPTMKTPPGPYPLVVTASFRRSADSYQLEGPLVCVPLISSTGHGDAALHRVHYQEGKFALADLLVALLPKNPNLFDSKYLYHLLMARKEEYFVPLMLGTANVSLKEKDIAGVEIPLPPLVEQRRIVAKIDELAGKIEEANKLKIEIDRTFRQLLQSAFAKITKGSKFMKMSEVAPITRRPIDVDLASQYPELGIRSFGNGTFHKPALNGMAVGNKKMFQIEPGDLIFNNVFAWEGAVAVAKAEDWGRFGSHRFITCLPKKELGTSEFLCFYFLTAEGLEKLGQASPGGAGRNRTLGLEALSKIEVPVPQIEHQIWFGLLQAKVESLKKYQGQTITELDTLLPSILDKAFKGEL